MVAYHKLDISDLPSHSWVGITAIYQIDKERKESKDWKFLGGQNSDQLESTQERETQHNEIIFFSLLNAPLLECPLLGAE